MIPHYGLIANTLAVPVMGMLVMPAAVLAAVLAPLGLHWIGLWLMRPGIEWILIVAHWVASLDGAVSFVPSPPPVAVPLLALGGLWVILWQGRARVAGVLPVTAALALWGAVERPDLLVAGSGGLVGIMTAEGRALSKPRGDGFTADSWLENDGDATAQEEAHARGGFSVEPGVLRFPLGQGTAVHLSGRGAADRVGSACAEAILVILPVRAQAPDGCRVIEAGSLAETGTVAIFAKGADLRTVTVRDWVGRRPWNDQ